MLCKIRKERMPAYYRELSPVVCVVSGTFIG
jgi:hypothetical protein